MLFSVHRTGKRTITWIGTADTNAFHYHYTEQTLVTS